MLLGWLDFAYSAAFTRYCSIYIWLRLGYGPAFVGQVNAVGGLAFALSSLPSSFLGSRWGNRRTMILGLSLAIVGMRCFPKLSSSLISTGKASFSA